MTTRRYSRLMPDLPGANVSIRSHLFMKSIRYALLLLPLLGMLEGCKSGGWGGGFSMPPAMVETAVASMQPVEDRFETVGTLEAEDAVTIVSEIGGIRGGRALRGGWAGQPWQPDCTIG